MSEDAVKRRRRSAIESVAKKLGPEWQIIRCSGGGPDIIADKPRRSRRIWIVFNHVAESDIEKVEKALAPDRCRKEIWKFSPNGRKISPIHITKTAKADYKANHTICGSPPRQYIYFLFNRSRNLVKVGKSLDTQRRFRELTHNQFDELELLAEVAVENSRVIEKAIHRKYAKFRVVGEWFKHGEWVTDAIYDLKWKFRVKPQN